MKTAKTLPQPKVTAIVLTWNSADFICAALNSLKNSFYPINILAIDNDSTDNTRQLIRKNYPDVEMHNTQTNLGYAGGNNYGIRLALKNRPDYIFILNPDAEVSKSCVEKLVDRLEAEPRLAAASPMIYYHNSSKIWFAGSWIKWRTGETLQCGQNTLDDGRYNTQRYTERLNGCAMLIRSTTIARVGLMDERYFLYYEESDWSMRFASHGLGNGFQPDAKVWHKVSSSTGGFHGSIYQYYMTRNRLLFVRKHKPYMLPAVVLLSIHPYIKIITGTQKRSGFKIALMQARVIAKGHLDFFLCRFGKQVVPN
ncbi:MAG TPA: glycosyltransferase family 2 protein [Patescibacteria group bacterium]|nr:glycosyltransferase family 2 protein [Patescibacteria group bacterium]